MCFLFTVVAGLFELFSLVVILGYSTVDTSLKSLLGSDAEWEADVIGMVVGLDFGISMSVDVLAASCSDLETVVVVSDLPPSCALTSADSFLKNDFQ